MADNYFLSQSQPTPMYPGSGAPTMSPFLNFGNLPGMGGPQGMLLQMVMAPLIQSFGGSGTIPSQFSPTMNLSAQYRNVWSYQSQVQAMNEARHVDQETYARALRGAARTAGVRMTADRERAVNMMSEDFSNFAPTLAQFMPETFDEMHGIRGSAIMMAQQIFQGGRYSLDPVTGRTGLSGDSAGMMAANIHDRLYGPGADITEMRGLGAGRVGQLYNEMQLRGHGVQALSRQDQLSALAIQQAGLGGNVPKALEGLHALDKVGDPDLASKLRSLEGGRVAQRLKEMAGVVSAMRDIFGEAGQPDAPMNQLIEGLQVLTQGGMSNMTAAKMEQTVRDTANLARRTGMGMDNFTQLMAQAAPRADAMGVNRSFLVSAAQQSAAYGQAYGIMAGDSPSWGKKSKEFITSISNQLTVGAAGSQVANQLAMTARLEDEYGLGSKDAGKLAEAIKGGDIVYGDKKNSVYLTPSAHAELMIEGLMESKKMSRESAASIVNQVRSQTARNQETTSKYDLDISTRRLQGLVDLQPLVGMEYQEALQTAGIGPDKALDMSRKVASAMFSMDPAKLRDTDAVLDEAGIIEKDPKLLQAIKSALQIGFGNVDQLVVRRPGLRGYGSAEGLFQSHNTRMMTESGLQRTEARLESRIQTAVSGIARATPLQRLMDAFITDPDGKTFQDLTKDVLGFIPTADVENALLPLMKELKVEMAIVNGQGELSVRKIAVGNAEKLAKRLQQAGEAQGLSGSKVSRDETKKAVDAATNRAPGFINQASDLYGQLLRDPKAIEMLGPGGINKVLDLRSGADQLQRLADVHSEKDVNALLASPEDREKSRELLLRSGESEKRLAGLKNSRKEMESGDHLTGGVALLAGGLVGVDLARDMAHMAHMELNRSIAAETKTGNDIRAQQEILRKRTGADLKIMAHMTTPDRLVTDAAHLANTQQKAGLGYIDKAVQGGQNYWDTAIMKQEKIIADNQPKVEAEELNFFLRDQAEDRVAGARTKIETIGTQRKQEADALKKLTAVNVMSPQLVFDKLLSSIGAQFADPNARPTDRRAALAGDVSRSMLLAMDRLKELVPGKKEDFWKYLQKGPNAGATEEEKELYKHVAPLAALAGRKNLQVGELSGIMTASDKRGGSREKLEFKDLNMTGTLTITNLGLATLNAIGNSIGGKHLT